MKPIRPLFILVLFVTLISGCGAYDGSKGNLSGDQLQVSDFNLTDLNGNQVFLSEYIGKKAVLLMFWTTWCPYCRVALLSLIDEYRALKDMDIEVLAIDIGESRQKVASFVRGMELNFTVLLDLNAQISDSYDVLGVPTYIIINKSGRVVFKGNRFSKARLKDLNLE